jgi:predicted AAA+ superfamily ATPase
LFDVGLARSEREVAIPTIDVLNTIQAQAREPLGGLAEQLLCCELIHHYPQLSGYKENTYEIDFILKWKNTTIPIECKASLKPNQNQYRSLDLYQRRFGSPIGIVVSLAPYSVVERDNYKLIHLPVYAIGCLEEILKEIESRNSVD